MYNYDSNINRKKKLIPTMSYINHFITFQCNKYKNTFILFKKNNISLSSITLWQIEDL